MSIQEEAAISPLSPALPRLNGDVKRWADDLVLQLQNENAELRRVLGLVVSTMATTTVSGVIVVVSATAPVAPPPFYGMLWIKPGPPAKLSVYMPWSTGDDWLQIGETL